MREVKSFADGGPRLYLCSTPIGNLRDVSYRLLDTLRSVDVIAAEDTRQTRKLLTHFELQPQLLVSYHEHNRATREEDFLRWWSEGKSIAVVTDAGTPGISDPGEHAARLAVQHGVPVVSIPGASAVLSALVCSGLPTQPFTFIGFLPRTRPQALAVLASVDALPGTVVLYEAPHRLRKTLALLHEVCPRRPVTLCKELTKLHETFFYADNPADALEHLHEEHIRGEFVIVLGPKDESSGDPRESAEYCLDGAVAETIRLIAEGIPHAQAVREVARKTGVKRKDLYQATLKHGSEANKTGR